MHVPRRGLVLALAVAGTAAGLIATWPASATSPQPQAPPKTVNQYFFHDAPGPIADTGGQIASVTLPKGSWVVTAKVLVGPDPTTPTPANVISMNVLCLTVLGSGPGADADTSGFLAPMRSTAGMFVPTGGPVVMTASHTFAQAGTVTVGCADFGTSAWYQQVRIQAVKVASIVRKQI